MDGAAGGYRGMREVLVRRRSELERRGAFLQKELAEVFAQRRRRTVFGVTLTLASIASFAIAGFGSLMTIGAGVLTEAAVLPLVLALPLGFAFAWLGTAVARKRHSPPLPPLPELDNRDEQALFDLQIAEGELAGYPKRLEGGVSWALVGLGWVLPLTLHFLVAIAIGETREFGAWIALSILISLQSHIALALLNHRFGRHVQGDAPGSVHTQWLKTLLITTLVASVPWIVLLAVPTIITVATGLVFIPAMYILTARRVKSEQARVSHIIAASFEESAGAGPYQQRIELPVEVLAPTRISAPQPQLLEPVIETPPVALRAFR